MIVICIISFFNALMKLHLKAFRGIVHPDKRRAHSINPAGQYFWIYTLNQNYDMHPLWVNYQSIYYYYLYVSHFQKQWTVSAFAYVNISEISMRCIALCWSHVTLYYIVEYIIFNYSFIYSLLLQLLHIIYNIFSTWAVYSVAFGLIWWIISLLNIMYQKNSFF